MFRYLFGLTIFLVTTIANAYIFNGNYQSGSIKANLLNQPGATQVKVKSDFDFTITSETGSTDPVAVDLEVTFFAKPSYAVVLSSGTGHLNAGFLDYFYLYSTGPDSSAWSREQTTTGSTGDFTWFSSGDTYQATLLLYLNVSYQGFIQAQVINAHPHPTDEMSTTAVWRFTLPDEQTSGGTGTIPEPPTILLLVSGMLLVRLGYKKHLSHDETYESSFPG